MDSEAYKVACKLCGSMLREAGLSGRRDNLRVRQWKTQGGKEIVAPVVGALKKVHNGIPCKILEGVTMRVTQVRRGAVCIGDGAWHLADMDAYETFIRFAGRREANMRTFQD